MADTDPTLPRGEAASHADSGLRRRAEDQLGGRPDGHAHEQHDAAEALVHELRVHRIELEMQNEELRRAQHELTEQHAKYFALFDLAPVGYVTLSDRGIVCEANITAARLLGLERQELVGQRFGALVPDPDRDVYYLHDRKLKQTGDPQNYELRLHRAGLDTEQDDADAFWVRIESRLDAGGGDMASSWVTFTDIDARRLEEEQLKDLNRALEARTLELSQRAEQLEAALKVKDVFLSSMSHELRTPLNSIIGFSAIMESGGAGELPAEAHKQIALVHESGKRLLAVVDTLLDSASMAASVVRPDVTAFELGDLMDAIEDSMGPAVRAAGLEFAIHRPSEPVTVVSDCGRIRQVLFNLIGNAVKFTKTGSVTVDVTIDEGRVRFAVADTGVGIATQHTELIMEPFEQLPQDGVAKTQGAGLGLAISAKIAAALGGEIIVASQRGVGSTFTLVLPLERPGTELDD
jgi:PAS domain S-box-containing protein